MLFSFYASKFRLLKFLHGLLLHQKILLVLQFINLLLALRLYTYIISLLRRPLHVILQRCLIINENLAFLSNVHRNLCTCSLLRRLLIFVVVDHIYAILQPLVMWYHVLGLQCLALSDKLKYLCWKNLVWV